MRQSDNLTGGGYGVPGSQSQAVQDAVDENFRQEGRRTMAAVVVPREGASRADVQRAVRRVTRAVRAEPDVAIAQTARTKALRGANGERTLVVPLALAVDDQEAIDVAVGLRERLGLDDGDAARGGVRTHLVGQGALWARMQEVAKHDVEAAERTGFPIVALILLGVFGSLAAAALPLALGFAAVLTTGSLIYALSLVMDMSVFVTNMASMIGIGVAVDYSLFVLARYREEIAAGQAPDAARATAMATSGLAVLFSGVTVIASLAGSSSSTRPRSARWRSARSSSSRSRCSPARPCCPRSSACSATAPGHAARSSAACGGAGGRAPASGRAGPRR
jgi:RND superfamily putative drug exporter